LITGGQAWYSVCLLHGSTVKATFNTLCELFGGGRGYQERKPGVLYETWGMGRGVPSPAEGCPLPSQLGKLGASKTGFSAFRA